MAIEGREGSGQVSHPHLAPGYTYDGEPEPEKQAEDAPDKPVRKPRAPKTNA